MIIGCDPGLSGAFAWFDDGRLNVLDMPTRVDVVNRHERRVIDEAQLEQFLRAHAGGLLVLEQVNGMPGQSGPAAFTFGYGVGVIVGAARSMSYRIERVAPSRWKAAMRVPASKDAARSIAADLWPGQAHLFARKKDDGRAEAALIALYGQQVFGAL